MYGPMGTETIAWTQTIAGLLMVRHGRNSDTELDFRDTEDKREKKKSPDYSPHEIRPRHLRQTAADPTAGRPQPRTYRRAEAAQPRKPDTLTQVSRAPGHESRMRPTRPRQVPPPRIPKSINPLSPWPSSTSLVVDRSISGSGSRPSGQCAHVVPTSLC